LVTIDLSAAYVAGLAGLDSLDGRHAAGAVGASLLTLGLAVGSWARRTELTRMVAPTLLSTMGTLVLVAAEGWAAPDVAVGTTVAILAAVALAAFARSLGLL